jgi:hypothetical protein
MQSRQMAMFTSPHSSNVARCCKNHHLRFPVCPANHVPSQAVERLFFVIVAVIVYGDLASGLVALTVFLKFFSERW